MGYPVTWFDVNAPDQEQSASFYAELFGWHTESMPEQHYVVIDTHGSPIDHGRNGINGGLGKAQEGHAPGTIVYAEAPDIQAVLEKAESLGGTTLLPVTETMMITFALFADPWGNTIGLVQGDGSTKVSQGDNPPVTWFEIGCSEPRKAWDFYRELLGWTIEEASGDQTVHGNADTGSGQGIPGGIGQSPDGRPNVTVYAQVDDLQKYLERAETLGAKTIVEPMAVADDTSIAMFVDPQGATFGLFVHQH
jgi:predicted enzyme related to lactoylglutathione lyase